MKHRNRILREIGFHSKMKVRILEEHYNYFLNDKPALKQKENAFYYPKRLDKNNSGTYNYIAFFKEGNEYWGTSCSKDSFDKSLYLKKQGLEIMTILV